MGPAFLKYRKAVRASGKGVPLRIGVEREKGFVSVFETEVFPPGDATEAATGYYAERIVKFLLWSRGGWKVHVQGPKGIADLIRKTYAPDGGLAFDVSLMSRVYEKPFAVVPAEPADFPAARESESALGGHLDGCRIGFDLGASDFKVAAVRDGVPVFSEEIDGQPFEGVRCAAG